MSEFWMLDLVRRLSPSATAEALIPPSLQAPGEGSAPGSRMYPEMHEPLTPMPGRPTAPPVARAGGPVPLGGRAFDPMDAHGRPPVPLGGGTRRPAPGIGPIPLGGQAPVNNFEQGRGDEFRDGRGNLMGPPVGPGPIPTMEPPSPAARALDMHITSPDAAGLFDQEQREQARALLAKMIMDQGGPQAASRGEQLFLGLGKALAAGGAAAGVEPLTRAYSIIQGNEQATAQKADSARKERLARMAGLSDAIGMDAKLQMQPLDIQGKVAEIENTRARTTNERDEPRRFEATREDANRFKSADDERMERAQRAQAEQFDITRQDRAKENEREQQRWGADYQLRKGSLDTRQGHLAVAQERLKKSGLTPSGQLRASDLLRAYLNDVASGTGLGPEAINALADQAADAVRGSDSSGAFADIVLPERKTGGNPYTLPRE